jgi:hypothetical protein
MAARRPKRTPRRRALLRLSAWVNTTTDGACGEALSIEKYRRYKTRVPSDGLTSWLCWDLVVGSPSSSRVRRARPPERTAQDLRSDQMCLAGRKVHDERDEAKEEETLDDPRER